MNLNSVAQYLGSPQLPYDFIFVDTDNIQTIVSFMLPKCNKLFFVTAYDQFDLQRTIEILRNLNQPMNVTKVTISADITDNQAKYLENLLREQTKVTLNQQQIDFVDTDIDRKVTLQNQLLKEISLKHHTSSYKNSLEYITSIIGEGIVDNGMIKREIKKM